MGNTLGAFSVHPERDAKIIALFDRAKAEGRSQSDLFREMSNAYIEKQDRTDLLITYMRFIIDELAVMKKAMQRGVVFGSDVDELPSDGMDEKKHDRLRGLGVVE